MNLLSNKLIIVAVSCPNQNREYLLTAIWRIYFHPAKFDNFKDEKMSDYKTVSITQSKNLLDWKPASLTNYELLLRAGFNYGFLGKTNFNLFFKYCSVLTKSLHKMKFKKTDFFFQIQL